MITVRQRRPDDGMQLRFLIELAADELKQYPGVATREDLHNLLDECEYVTVAEDSGSLVGYCAWIPNLPTATAAGTFVHKDYRKRGISKLMRAEAAAHCRLFGCRGVLAEVHDTNAAGLASLKADGFEVVGYMMLKKL